MRPRIGEIVRAIGGEGHAQARDSEQMHLKNIRSPLSSGPPRSLLDLVEMETTRKT